MADWPTGEALVHWLGANNLGASGTALAGELVDEATELVRMNVEATKLPTDPTVCPATIRRAIVIEAARLLSRKDSTQGIVAFGDLAIRLASADADVSRLLLHWRPDPEA
jgi:hypothetical protein